MSSKLVSFTLAVSIIVSLVAVPAQAQIPQSERDALIALYNSTNGDNWTRANSWLGKVGSECNWFGVECNKARTTVVGLDFFRNRLTGALPPELGQLSNLSSLWIRVNPLAGPIPAELGQLTNLTSLQLSDNYLEGSIPPELGQLGNLTELGLSGNELTGSIPPELGQLTKLTRLSLGGNQLTGSIPPELGQLSNLTHLSLQDNMRCTSEGCVNGLSGPIPPELGQLQQLTFLNLNGNMLTGAIPVELSQLSNLETLWLNANQLTGPIPPQLGQLSNLGLLEINYNQLTGGLPPELGQLSNLYQFGLYSNQLSGPIPAEYGQLTKLIDLALGANKLTGPIPDTFLNLTSILDSRSVNAGITIGYNGLWTSNPELDAFLDSIHRHNESGDWSVTQTVAPNDVQVMQASNSSMTLTWTPIEYVNHSGRYEVYVSEAAGGPFTVSATTPDKSTSVATVSGLTASTEYFIKVRTVTDQHCCEEGWTTDNWNAVISEFSPLLTAVTTGGEPGGTPSIVVSSAPDTMVQEVGVGGATTSFTITNVGDASTSIVLLKDGAFFEQAPEIFTLQAGGTQIVSVSGLPQPEGAYDGASIVTGNGCDNLQVPIRLISEAPPAETAPEIVYLHSAKAGAAWITRIMVMDADGSNQTVVVDCGTRSCSAPEWMPDGRRIVFVADAFDLSDPPFEEAIYTVDLDGQNLEHLIDLNGGPGQPTCSPQPIGGQYWVAFSDQDPSTTSGHHDLFACGLSDGMVVQLTDLNDGAVLEPAWSADGRYLAIRWEQSLDPLLSDINVLEIEEDAVSHAPTVYRIATVVHDLPYALSSPGWSGLVDDNRLLLTGGERTFLFDLGSSPLDMRYDEEWGWLVYPVNAPVDLSEQVPADSGGTQSLWVREGRFSADSSRFVFAGVSFEKRNPSYGIYVADTANVGPVSVLADVGSRAKTVSPEWRHLFP